VPSNAFWWSGTIDKELRRMSVVVKDRGLSNRALDALPFVLHIPEYQFAVQEGI